MTLPTVTVVVPALNAEPWIEDSLSSIVAQSYPSDSLEVIVVDDGSTDDTAGKATALLRASGLTHAVLTNGASRGPSASRNRGWRHGRGEWIQFLDADDLIEPCKIEAQVGAGHHEAAEVAVVYSTWGRLHETTDGWRPDGITIDPSIGSDPAFDLLRSDNFIATGSQIFRRQWLERVNGYIETYDRIEDVDLLLRIAFADGVFRRLCAPQPLFWYRQRPGSLSRQSGDAFIDGCVRNARQAEHRWRDHGSLEDRQKRLLADIYFDASRHYAGRDHEAFLEAVRDLYRVDPAFVPPRPAALRALSRLVGYVRAEKFAVQYRRFRQHVGGTPSPSDGATKVDATAGASDG
jgi:glycosyltransferase involved in cell wall biosynthesis